MYNIEVKNRSDVYPVNPTMCEAIKLYEFLIKLGYKKSEVTVFKGNQRVSIK